ncbi:unnamed protein product [Peniophora sp. CBMAI 1063]|nr:unnamed protein product [Peniophora sp. CBMAI 1063]
MAPPPFTKVTSTNTDDPELALPDRTLTGSESTPQRLKLSGYMRNHSGRAFIRAKPLYKSLAKEMRGMFLGPMPVMTFLKRFLPCETERNCPNISIAVREADFKLKKRVRGKTAEDKICDAINDSEVLSNLHFQNTSDTPLSMLDSFPESERADRKVDISAFIRTKPGSVPKPSFEALRLPIELKPPAVDIVVNPTGKTSEERKKEGFEHQTAEAIEARGQLSSYTLHQFQHQDCTHAFSVLIFGLQARLLRTDHSGVIVTEAFDYTKGDLFTEFLWRFDRALDGDGTGKAGVDTSVTPLAQDDDVVLKARQAFANAEDELPYVITPETPLRKIIVWDEYTCAPSEAPPARELIVAPSVQHSFSPLGRYTLSFPAYDPETNSVCWMKDAWRIAVDGFEKEGDTYAKLTKLEGIEGLIPEVLCAGDVRDSEGKKQATETQDHVGADWAAHTYNIHRYVHYRIVFKTIGRPLTTFKNTKELVQAMADALKAHTIAYNDGDILHRDISINNILIRNGRGLLIDWDMCKHLDKNEPRVPWRTGTWQFIAAQLLDSPRSTTHTLRHDLESFMWLLLYATLRYHYRLPHLEAPVAHKSQAKALPKLNLPPSTKPNKQSKRPRPTMPQRQVTYMDWAEVQAYVHYLFDDKKEEGESTPKGGERKKHFLFGTDNHPTNEHIAHAVNDFETRIPPPLAKLISDLRDLFAPLYTLKGVVEDEVQDLEEERVGSAIYVEHFFNEALTADGWRDNDAGQDHFVFEQRTRKRRRGDEEQLEAEDSDADVDLAGIRTACTERLLSRPLKIVSGGSSVPVLSTRACSTLRIDITHSMTGMDNMSRMRVLSTPELLDGIFVVCTRKEIARFALVCRTWLGPAQDHIWRVVETPCQLFRVLAPVHCPGKAHQSNGHTIERIPTKADWRRFTPIASRVRVLQVSSRSETKCKASLTAVLSDIAVTRPPEGIFPNLQHVDLVSTNLPHAYMTLLLSPSLTSLNASMPTEKSGHTLGDFLEDLVAGAPGLTSLSLVASQHAGHRARNYEQAIGALPAHLPRLAVLKLPPYFLTSTVLSMFSTSQIAALEFSELRHSTDNAGDPHDVALLRPELEEGAFPALRRLSICGRLTDLHDLFSDPHFPTGNLSELVIRGIRSESEADTRDIIKELVDRCRLLTNFFLLMTPPASPVSTPGATPEEDSIFWVEDEDAEPLTIETLRPLATLHHLQRISVVHAQPLLICDADVRYMCSRLPGLRRLVLNPAPRTRGTPALTLLSMIHISSHCPRIHSLALYANASADVKYPVLVTALPARMHLQLHASPLLTGCRGEVIRFLSRILRPGTSLKSAIAPMADAGSPGSSIGSSSAWGWIVDRLPLILEMRQEERELVALTHFANTGEPEIVIIEDDDDDEGSPDGQQSQTA